MFLPSVAGAELLADAYYAAFVFAGYRAERANGAAREVPRFVVEARGADGQLWAAGNPFGTGSD